jgi:hypothetical protein
MSAANPSNEQEARAISVAVWRELTRKQFNNVAKPEDIHGPMNTFVSLTAFSPADMKVVVRPNFDADGSLDLNIQNANPGADMEAKLAAGAEGTVQPHDATLCS